MKSRRFVLDIVYIAVGAVLLYLSCTGVLSEAFGGFGGGRAAIGILQTVKNIRYATNDEYKEKTDIEVNDERNKYIRMKAWSWAGYMFVIAAGCVTIIAMIIKNDALMQTAAFGVCGILMLYVISYYILQRKN